MPTLRMYLKDARIGEKFAAATKRYGAKAQEAARRAAKKAADEIEVLGRADIKSAGRFGIRWVEGFEAKVKQGGGNIRIEVTEKVPYWPVFEFGATIKGDPLLWIPFSFADDAQGVNARDYDGTLFRVDRNSDGLPMLFDADDPDDGPVYFAKPQVHEPKKFHLRDIIRTVAKELPAMYQEELAKLK